MEDGTVAKLLTRLINIRYVSLYQTSTTPSRFRNVPDLCGVPSGKHLPIRLERMGGAEVDWVGDAA